MPQLGDENEKVTNSVIPNGTEAKVMRNLIENKGLLNGKGKLYAGTADTTSTGAPVTTAIDPSGADDDSVLIKDSSQAGGWKVDKVGKDNIKDAAITPEKLQATGDFNAHSFSSKDDNIKYHADYRADRIIFNSTAKDSDGQVTLVPSIAVGQTVMLGLPSEDGTLVTAEEIESGEIVAKIAQNATNATNATNAKNTDFTNAKWSDSVESATLTAGLYQILIGSTYTYLFHYDGRTTIGNAGGDIVCLAASPTSGTPTSAPDQIFITTHSPSVSNSVLTISTKVYTITTSGFVLYDSGNEHFKYRKIH